MNKETLEEAAETFLPRSEVEHDTDFIIGFEQGAKWQQERMYSEDEVSEMITMARKICSIDGNIDLDDDSLQGNLEGFGMKYTINQIFEQLKKK